MSDATREALAIAAFGFLALLALGFSWQMRPQCDVCERWRAPWRLKHFTLTGHDLGLRCSDGCKA